MNTENKKIMYCSLMACFIGLVVGFFLQPIVLSDVVGYYIAQPDGSFRYRRCGTNGPNLPTIAPPGPTIPVGPTGVPQGPSGVPPGPTGY